MFNSYDQIIRLHENAWTMNYLFPEKYTGAKVPEHHQAPSNTTVVTIDRLVKAHEGTFVGFFSPVIETCAPYFGTYDVNSDLPTGDLDQYIVYADNAGAQVPVTNNVLDSLSTWGFRRGPSYDKLGAYKRLRIVGACLEISIKDRADDYSGIIETCLGFEVIGNSLKNDSVDITKMMNNPHYKTYKPYDRIILKYRYNNEKYLHYGPYEPFSSVPYHLIKISGLSNTASIHIKAKIHIEGMLMPSLVHFATHEVIPQTSRALQTKLHTTIPVHDSVTTEDESGYHHSNILNIFMNKTQKPATLMNSESFPRDIFQSKTEKGKKILIDDDLLKKRQSFKVEHDALNIEEQHILASGSDEYGFGRVLKNLSAEQLRDIMEKIQNKAESYIRKEALPPSEQHRYQTDSSRKEILQQPLLIGLPPSEPNVAPTIGRKKENLPQIPVIALPAMDAVPEQKTKESQIYNAYIHPSGNLGTRDTPVYIDITDKSNLHVKMVDEFADSPHSGTHRDVGVAGSDL